MGKIWLKTYPEGIPHTLDYGTTSLPARLEEQANAQPDKAAIIFYGRVLTYRELSEEASQFAAALRKLGVNKGDRVAFFLENCPQFIIAYLGVLRCGAVLVALNPMFKRQELAYELEDTGAETLLVQDLLYPVFDSVGPSPVKRVIVTSLSDYLPNQPSLPLHPDMHAEKQVWVNTYDFAELLRDPELEQIQLEQIELSDLALLQYTSGTTGIPKGAMITHGNIIANSYGASVWHNYTQDDIHLTVAPLFHITGMILCMSTPLFSGGTIVLFTRFDVEVALKAIELYRVSALTAVTTVFLALINYPHLKKYDTSTLKLSISGGAPVPLEVLRKYRELIGTDLLQGYGMSETTAPVTQNNRLRPKDDSVGPPLIDVDVKIVDLVDGEREVALGEEGELWVKGPQVMVGYWNKPEETAAFLRDGWLATGDIMKMDEEGYLYIRGRKKELIKASGYSVFPAEVEALLYRHPAIAEVAVVGIPHPYRQEDVKAFITLKPEYKGQITEEDMVAWARDNMAVYKYPRQVEFRDSLPKTASGKLLRRMLADEERQKAEAKAN
ncbi:long-chain fatty acid--CoA ligase [Paradesulfitobacterium aromaticivorans]